MLVTVGGLMATIFFPGKAVPTLAVTATLSAVSAIRRHRARGRGHEGGDDEEGQVSMDGSAPVTLEWDSVSCSLSTKKGESDRKILSNASGKAEAGRILAIMGPSGGGKTTLLNTLAGRVQKSSNISIEGTVKMNGRSMNDVLKNNVPIAYVLQEDLFFSQLTVRETLDIAARLRKDDNNGRSGQVTETTDALIRKLGLVSCADSTVGDEKNRGISGGEKKRLSLGIELISTPRLILCDEPTTGLDAFQAERVMDTLRALARAGHTVVCSIHQPSSAIFSMFDDLVLLSEGRQVYSGEAGAAEQHFTKLGYNPPTKHFNPAERYLQLISIDFSSDDTVRASRARIDGLIAAGAGKGGVKKGGIHGKGASTSRTGSGSSSSAMAIEANGFVGMTHGDGRGRGLRIGKVLRQMRVLFSRAWKQAIRDRKTNVSRLMSSVMSALLFGSMYWKLGVGQHTVQDRLGLLQVCSINAAMTSLVKTLNVFPREGALVNRERVRGTYGVLQYLTSKLCAELPIGAMFPLLFSSIVYPMAGLSNGVTKLAKFLGIVTLESFTCASYGLVVGALVPSTDAALAVGPSTFVLQVVFGGFYISDKTVPKWMSWIPKISIIKHAFEGLCVNELRGLKLEGGEEKGSDGGRPSGPGSGVVETGDEVLERLSWGKSTVRQTCVRQMKVLLFNYLMTYTILELKKPRFEQLKKKTPSEEEEEEEEKQGKGEKSGGAKQVVTTKQTA